MRPLSPVTDNAMIHDRKFRWTPELSITRLIVLCAFLFTAFYNVAFFRNALTTYADDPTGMAFFGSLAVLLFSVSVLVLSLLCVRFLTKPVLILVIIAAAAANAFMSQFNVVIDTTMITNILATDTKEVRDLVTPGLLLHTFLLGGIPAVLLWRTRIQCHTLGREVWNRVKLVGLSILLMLVAILPFSSQYTSFFREHKLLRYYANPATFIYSTVKVAEAAVADSTAGPRRVIGSDARIVTDSAQRSLVILVVGEAARADHFGLNGYPRDTTPRLGTEDVISFSDITACGTATAYSVPCMFALETRAEFDLDEARHSENLLDVLQRAGVNVLWRDNNSDSKGVAVAVPFEDFQHTDRNPVCDSECRDIGMLSGLDHYIDAHADADLVIVLHQMGNHGPAYAHRYPAEFEHFTPTCQSAELGSCSDEEITNAYDNALRYTDYFLSEVITFLKGYDSQFRTAMYYISDHGESLGENGLYLHGLPWLMAPDAQKHIASLVWLGSGFAAQRAALTLQANQPASHDNLFHTMLTLLRVRTSILDPTLSLLPARY